MASDTAGPYEGMRRQIVLALLAFGLVPLLAAGVASHLASRAAAESQQRRALWAIVANRKTTVELFLDATMRQLRLVAEEVPVSRLVSPATLEAILAGSRLEGGALVDLGVIGEDGRHVAYAGPYRLEGFDYSGQEWFEQVRVRGRYESDVFLGFRRFPHMVMAVQRREGGKDWIVRATIDTDRLSALVREGGLETGADVFVLNRAGLYQTRAAREHRLMERADLPPVPLHAGVSVSEVRTEGATERVATAWLRGEAWVLVARQRVPSSLLPPGGHPAVTGVLLAGVLVVPVLAVLVARGRLHQIRELETERAALWESVAQSQKLAAIGLLAAGVAHEVNNPLAIIQAQVGVISDLVAETPGAPHADEFRERISKIEAQLKRGRGVTHQLLGFSRRVGPERETIDVAAALDETVGFAEKQLDASKVRIVREYAPDVPLIRSSLSRIQQVFLNLINNALDAVGESGEVRLVVEAADGGVRVLVADDGPGIPEKLLPRVFEPFYSTKGAAGGRGGAGLGLAICKEITTVLGGSIRASSGPARGTTFTVWLPLDAEEA